MIDPISALGIVKSVMEPPSSGAPAAPASGADFGSVLNHVITDAVRTIGVGEATAIKGIEGAAPPFKVVQAVMAAQRALQETLAIRDKAVAAYQEITRMAI